MFEHHILHEGSLLKEGRKYTMRTDVMYSKETYSDIEKDIEPHEDFDIC